MFSLFHVGGLDVRPLAELCRSIAAMGFTVVRLPFSSEMLRIDGVPEGAIDYNINKDLEGLSPLQVYDRVIDELGAAGVTVVINNHTTVGAWSGGVELNGMWFRNQCEIYTEQSWIDDWVMMAKRYEHQPQVIGYDIRNEVRPTSMMGPSPRWGKTDATYDWSRAAGSCARALMDAAAPGLLVIERIAWPQNSLREMLSPKPPWEAWNVPRDRIVLSVHMYAWSGPGAWSPKHFMPGLLRSVFDVVDYVGARALYGEMGQAALETQMDQDFGFCIDEDLCPVWLSELGCSLDSELEWFGKERKDVDFAYWPLNVGPKPGSGADDEAYGILTNDWQPRWADPRLQALRRLCPEPLIPSPRKVRRPLQLPRSRADSAGTPSPFHVITPSPDTAAVATPSCYGQVDEPLWRAPFPWCQPLPGPLVPWPGEPWSKEMPEARYIWEVLDGIDSDPGKDGESLELCGHTCAKQVGSWYVFDLYQSCACAPCDEEKAEAAEASAVMPATEEKPEKTEKSLKAMDKEGSWDAASLLGSNVLYCPCGPGCAYGRQLGMTTYYCFRYGCRPCYRQFPHIVTKAPRPRVKELCCRQRCGGFALHKGIAYFRLASPEGLLMRQQPGFTSTTLYLAKEVRLCATWLELEEADGSRFDSSSRTVGPGDLISLPLDEEPEAKGLEHLFCQVTPWNAQQETATIVLKKHIRDERGDVGAWQRFWRSFGVH
eukprot:g2874.t1